MNRQSRTHCCEMRIILIYVAVLRSFATLQMYILVRENVAACAIHVSESSISLASF